MYSGQPKARRVRGRLFLLSDVLIPFRCNTNRNGSRGAVRQAGAELGSASCSAGIVLLLLQQMFDLDALKPQHRNSFFSLLLISEIGHISISQN